jgi:hypothetical protein
MLARATVVTRDAESVHPVQRLVRQLATFPLVTTQLLADGRRLVPHSSRFSETRIGNNKNNKSNSTMPPFSEDTIIDRYTPHPRRIVVDDTPPVAATTNDVVYRSPRRPISANSFDWSPCPAPLFSRQQQTHRKRVLIALEENETYEVLHVLDYSHHEIRSTWLSLEELKESKRNSKRIIQQWKKGAEGCCLRGLEAKSSEQAKLKRRQNKSDVRFAVLSEQSKQKYATGTIDQDKIAYVSLDCTEHCRMQATKVGLRDEQEAISVIMESYEIEESLFGYNCTGLLLLTQAAA